MVKKSLKYLGGGLVGLVVLSPRFTGQVVEDLARYHSIMSPLRYDIGTGWEQSLLTLGLLGVVAYGAGRLIKRGLIDKL